MKFATVSFFCFSSLVCLVTSAPVPSPLLGLLDGEQGLGLDLHLNIGQDENDLYIPGGQGDNYYSNDGTINIERRSSNYNNNGNSCRRSVKQRDIDLLDGAIDLDLDLGQNDSETYVSGGDHSYTYYSNGGIVNMERRSSDYNNNGNSCYRSIKRTAGQN